VRLDDLSRLAAQLEGVSESRREGLLHWRYRDLLVQSFPETFSVPGRFAKHMMVVADLEHGNPDAVEDAIIAAWELQPGS